MSGNRTSLLAVVFAFLLITAGCAQSVSSGPATSDENSPDQIIQSATPPPTTQTIEEAKKSVNQTTSETTSNSNAVPTRQVGNFTFYNLTDEKAESIKAGMTGFFAKLPENRSERLDISADVANKSCKEGTKINKSVIEKTDTLNRQGYRVYHAALTFNKRFNDHIQPSRVKSVLTTTGKVAKYTTVIGAYNEYYEASCAFDRDDPESVKHFYYASASLGLEIYLIQYQVYYKSSLVLTRMASHTRAFRMVQRLFGDDALRILMSETHWLLRNSLQGANQFVGDEAASMNISLSRVELDRDTVRSELERAYGFSLDSASSIAILLERTDPQTAVDCGRKAIEESSESGLGGVIDSVSNSKYLKMLEDGKLTESEYNQLPSDIQKGLKDCLISNS